MKILNFFKKEKSINEVIQEIHDSFDNEVNILYEESNKISLELAQQKTNIIQNKAKRLENLGFTSSIEVNHNIDLEMTSFENLRLIKAIKYFKINYPLYKFITEDSVIKLCKKYGLVYSTVNNYIGTVPEKNLKEIENFKVKDEDSAWVQEYQDGIIDNIYFISYQKYLEEKGIHNNIYINKKASLEIVAARKDFREDLKISNFKGEIPDPIVLYPVYHEKRKYYLIVTAWGLEASDPLVINEKLN